MSRALQQDFSLAFFLSSSAHCKDKKKLIPDFQQLTGVPVTPVTVLSNSLAIPLSHNQNGYGNDNYHPRRPPEFQAGIAG